jgi:hypothetical protein
LVVGFGLDLGGDLLLLVRRGGARAGVAQFSASGRSRTWSVPT